MKCYRCRKDLPPTSFYARAQAQRHPHLRRSYSGYCIHCTYLYLKGRRCAEQEEEERIQKERSQPTSTAPQGNQTEERPS